MLFSQNKVVIVINIVINSGVMLKISIRLLNRNVSNVKPSGTELYVSTL